MKKVLIIIGVLAILIIIPFLYLNSYADDVRTESSKYMPKGFEAYYPFMPESDAVMMGLKEHMAADYRLGLINNAQFDEVSAWRYYDYARPENIGSIAKELIRKGRLTEISFSERKSENEAEYYSKARKLLQQLIVDYGNDYSVLIKQGENGFMSICWQKKYFEIYYSYDLKDGTWESTALYRLSFINRNFRNYDVVNKAYYLKEATAEEKTLHFDEFLAEKNAPEKKK